MTCSQPLSIQVLAYWESEEYEQSPVRHWQIENSLHIQNPDKHLLGRFCSEACVTLTYIKPWNIHNPNHIHNTVKHISWYILSKTLCNLDIFRTLTYSQLSYILKSQHFSPYWLRTVCNYNIFRYNYSRIYSKLSFIQSPCVSGTP